MNNEAWIKETWEKLDKKLSRTAVSSFDKIPYTTVNGVHDNKFETTPSWWTNGFWPALMILMYAGTKKEQYLKTCRNAMDIMDEALFGYDGLHHDVGFMWNISSGVDYRLTGDKKQRKRFLIATNYLMARYNCLGEFFKAWNGPHHNGTVIIDCMMNLPLLFRASAELQDDLYADAAIKHIEKAIKYHVRPDWSCNHINQYDTKTGEFILTKGGQGYCEGSSWSRGQSWGVYGFALAYKHTKNPKYLDVAKNIAKYFITNVQKSDWLPLVDFIQPAEPLVYDSTAGACAACGLLEIADNVPESEKAFYYDAAVNILKAMEAKFCDWSDTEDSILQMGMEAYGRVQMPIIYGDYFFAEGIYRLMGFDTKELW